ncbi:MAG TPA: aminoglycoside phosphotransferase family protein [Ideonella sp.]|uniref:aminoglycoside phosphotransferase family protein n=1 Tax=Ideonella sp. TaxID=1929293 RepID=UPI002E2FA38C|nr:aminoglycoside phosphotransferase family protein [Ideonella sp.]HEX5686765.1 aminoglycoside phosphotransferase family protein [Ideonella sp.]
MSETLAVIDERLVSNLVAEQFPHWAHLPVSAVARGGWDNRTFHLGDELLVRLPSGPAYAAQVLREQRWLPHLAPHLTLAIPEPVAMGRPGGGYPWHWSVYRWLTGQAVVEHPVVDLAGFTADLARFLVSLQSVDASQGPAAGVQTFHRGGALSVYDAQCRAAVQALEGRIDTAVALRAWELALSSSWGRAPVWVHGDIALGNLLLLEGKLHAVIDFGQLCVGDPACDLAIAWTFLRGAHRAAFREALAVDLGTWRRGRAWALWKAAIIAAGISQTNAVEGAACWQTLDEIVIECARNEA